MPPQPADHPDVQVFQEIERIEQLARVAVTRCLPVGLSYPQYEVLNLLMRRGDGITPADITASLHLTKNGLTNTLQRLAARQLVRVEGCANDGRRKRVWLTADGQQAYAQAMASVRPKLDGLRDGFTQKEFRDALPFLRALRSWLESG